MFERVSPSGRIARRGKRRRAKTFRMGELLEPRLMLSGIPPAIVVGRTLSSYFAGDVQNHQETLNFTVYNELADPVTGVLLTDTLRPGVTFSSASILPDQSGQNLAWSLGSIPAFGRASVSLTVNLPNAIPSQLDTGAVAFGNLNAGAVTDSAPVATLRTGSLSNTALLASTPDANAADPFIQEKAAALDYDAQQIFDYLHNEVGYNSYIGSLRGARGTLWSSAGNALDVASLGVALMRASGNPVQYVSGTLSQSQAQQLILSMFPASFQTVGYIAPGTLLADPANDAQLLAETESHYWFQFDVGGSMTDADPLMSATIGQAFTSPSGTFTEVADSLRAKTEVKLMVESYSQIAAALSSSGLSNQLVLDQTFDDVDLVGRSLSVGNLVSVSNTSAFIISSQNYTYSPYILVNEEDGNTAAAETLHGTQYQEILTNLPLATTFVTGLFLDVTTIAPQLIGPAVSHTVEKTLFDRIGYAARHGAGNPNVSVDPTSGPIVNPANVVTLLITASADPGNAALSAMAEELREISPRLSAIPIDQQLDTAGTAALSQFGDSIVEDLNTIIGVDYLSTADEFDSALQRNALVRAYYDSPRIIAISNALTLSGPDAGGQTEIDILKDTPRRYAAPIQAATMAAEYSFVHGALISSIESTILAQEASTGGGTASASIDTFNAALDGGAVGVAIDSTHLNLLAGLSISDEAKARITVAAQAGLVVLVPSLSIDLGKGPVIAWIQIDPTTGDSICVSQDGGHQAISEYHAMFPEVIEFLEARAATNEYYDGMLQLLRTGLEMEQRLLAQGLSKSQVNVQTFQKLAQLTRNVGPKGSPFRDGFFQKFNHVYGPSNPLDPALGADVNINALMRFFMLGDPTIGASLFAFAHTPISVMPDTVSADSFFTVPYNGAELPTAFQAHIQNLGMSADTYDISLANLPAGFDALRSVPRITIPPGQIGTVGVYLRPNSAPLPAPGTPLNFTFTADSQSNPANSKHINVQFEMPVVDAVQISTVPDELNSTPGASVSAVLTLHNVGNVSEGVALSAELPAGVSSSPLAPLTLGLDETKTVSITLTPAANTALNTLLSIRVTATFGAAGSPTTQTIELPLRIAAPGAVASARAADAVGQLGGADLANRLSDFATDLTNLFQAPGSAEFKSQALAALDALIGLLTPDKHMAGVIPTLQSNRASLAAATTAASIQSALTNLGTTLSTVTQILTDELNHGLTLSLDNSTATALPGAPAGFVLDLRNVGIQTTTYDLSVSGLPAGVTAVFKQNGNTVTSVTAQPGEELHGGANGVTLLLTQTGSSLIATGFTVTATPQGAAEIAEIVQGTLTVRDSFVNVTAVDATPAFTSAGNMVHVTAKVLNAVNAPRNALATCVVTDSSNATKFALPTPIAVSLTVQTSLITVDLGSFDTTGFANGSYTITVSLTDTSNVPIPGATGTGTVLVGSPISADISTSPSLLPPGSGQVTNTLHVSGQASLPSVLTLKGQVQTTPTATTVALYDDGTNHLAYVAGTNGIDIVDITNPAAPVNDGTFAANLIVQGGFTVLRVDNIAGTNFLVVGSTINLNASQFTILVYSLADPLHPSLLNTPSGTGINYAFAADLLVSGDKIVVPTDGFSSSFGSIFNQFGTVLELNLSTPAAPVLGSVLDNGNQNPPFAGTTMQFGGAIVNSQYAYIASTTSTGGGTQSGVGRVLVMDYSNAANLQKTGELNIPGTNRLLDIAISGNRALLVGSTGGYKNPFNGNSDGGLVGNLTVTMLDISDPANPQIIGNTLVTNGTFPKFDAGVTKISALPLGNGLFAISEALVGGNPVLLIVDPTDPANIVVTTKLVPHLVNEMAVSGNLLYTTSSDGLVIYTIGTLVSIPFSASVQVPHNSVVAGSYNFPPTQVIGGAMTDTLVWNRALASGESSYTFSWKENITNLQPGQTQKATLGTTINFVSSGTPGTVTLPPTSVSSLHIIGLNPASRSVAPTTTASYDVSLFNPTTSPVIYNLGVQGVPGAWVSLPSSVNVGAGATTHVMLQLTSDAFATLDDYSFVVTASTVGGTKDAALGDLILAGAPPTIDPESHAVVVKLTPTTATTGIGDPVTYSVQVTNTGSATDTFALSLPGLPPGIAASLTQNGQPISSVTVPPGVSNFRIVVLTLTPAAALAGQTPTIQVRAISTTQQSINSTASGTLAVLTRGVSVALSPSSAAPGSTFQMTVKNTGLQSDTYTLSLAGPAALVATLASTQVTLAAGAMQVINITTSAANFADAGLLPFMAIATSQASAAVKSSAAAALVILDSNGLSAQFAPPSQTLPQPGAAAFVLDVNNLGNVEDAYTASIIGTSGLISASLMDLNGNLTQTVPVFHLPGLATGALLLNTTTSRTGPATVQVKITSLNDPNRSTIVNAQVRVGSLNDVGDAAILLLDAQDKGQLTSSGNGGIRVLGSGKIIIDSANSKAGVLSGNGNVSASEIDVVGKLSRTGKGKYLGTIVEHAAAVTDPLASLTTPTPPTTRFKAVNVSSKSITLSPGTYVGGIKISGSAKVTLLPGLYYLQGGGLSVSGKATLTGKGVTIYNAPTKTTDGINIAPNTNVTLTAPSDGSYQSVVVFEDRRSHVPIAISGGNVNLTGIVYAADAPLKFSGNQGMTIASNTSKSISAALIVEDLVTSGSGTIIVDTSANPTLPHLVGPHAVIASSFAQSLAIPVSAPAGSVTPSYSSSMLATPKSSVLSANGLASAKANSTVTTSIVCPTTTRPTLARSAQTGQSKGKTLYDPLFASSRLYLQAVDGLFEKL